MRILSLQMVPSPEKNINLFPRPRIILTNMHILSIQMVPSPEEAESSGQTKSRFQAWFQTPTAKSSHSNSIANSRSTSRKSSLHEDELEFLQGRSDQ